MRRIITICLFSLIVHGQYVLDRGIYIGGTISGTGNYLFQELGAGTDNNIESTYKGTGFQYDFSIIYAINRRNFLELSFGRLTSEIRHKSSIYDQSVVDKNITTKREFTELSTLYSYVFPNMNLMFGGGTKIYMPINNKNDYDLTVNGELHIGLKYQYRSLNTIPYVSYAFPLSNLRSSGNDEIRIGTLQFGVKIWFKAL